jgi:hypothetical protein
MTVSYASLIILYANEYDLRKQLVDESNARTDCVAPAAAGRVIIFQQSAEYREPADRHSGNPNNSIRHGSQVPWMVISKDVAAREDAWGTVRRIRSDCRLDGGGQ